MNYGQVLVCGNYEGHTQKIADTLNQWQFEVTFEVQDGRILPDERWVCCPTAFPYRLWVIAEDGHRIPADEFEYPVGETFTEQCETVPLEEVARLIRPWLSRGTIEIVAIGDAYVERLIVRADGSAERWSQQFDETADTDWAETEIEKCKTLSFRDVVPGWGLDRATAPESLS